MSSDRTDLAHARTDLAEDRTVLAHERSFAGWVRTGMAAVGLGLGFHALFRSVEPVWVPKLMATGFLIVATFVFRSAERRASRILDRLEPHKIAALRPVRLRLLSWALIAATLGLGAAIWLLV